MYSALDPRLFSHKTAGSIYWVISYDGSNPPMNVRNYYDTSYFERMVVLREDRPGLDVSASMERLVSRLESDSWNDPVIGHTLEIMKGCIFQAQGDIALAADAYRTVGTEYPVGEEHLRTAQGLLAHGDRERAWREALTSKFNQPGNVAVHRWLALNLLDAGDAAQSRVEAQIAETLRSKSKVQSSK